MKPESIAGLTAKGESGTPNPIPSETGKQSRSVNRMQVDSGANHGESVAKVGVNRDDLPSEPGKQVRSEPAGHRRASLCFEGGSNVLGTSVQDGAAKLEPRGLVCRMVVLFCEGSGGMKLEAGEWYVARDKSIIGPAMFTKEHDTYPWRIADATYTDNGRANIRELRDWDAMEHLPRTDERHPQWAGEATDNDAETECSGENEYVEVLMRMPRPPEGWQYTGEFRVPEEGEEFVDKDGLVTTMADTSGMYPCPIVVEDWQPPAWMPKGWYCVDECGEEWCFDNRPMFQCGEWVAASETDDFMNMETFRFDRPTVRGKNAIWEVK